MAKNLNDRFKNTLLPSGGIPFRMDIPLPDNSKWIKSGSGNKQDVPLSSLAVYKTFTGNNIVPEIYPGFYFVKSNSRYLPTVDSIILKDYSEDDDYVTYNILELPLSGKYITVEMYGKPINNQPSTAAKYEQVDKFSTSIVDGQEVLSPKKYEYMINSEDKTIVFNKSGFFEDYLIPNNPLTPTIDEIKLLDKIGTGNGNAIQILNLTKFPILPDSLRVFIVNENETLFREMEICRSVTQMNSLSSEDICGASPEFGLIILGENAINGNKSYSPNIGETIYVAYTALPYIEYTPENTIGLHIPEYLNISPSASGVVNGFIQISSSVALTAEKLVLSTSAPVINRNSNVYGPLQVIYDMAYMQCIAYNHYSEPVQHIEITWHMDIDVGSINGYDITVPYSNYTNFDGIAYASYLTPLSVTPLENIFDESTIVTPISGIEWFQDSNLTVYDSRNVLLFTNYTNLESARYNSNGDGLVKLVTWATVQSENNNPMEVATVVHPSIIDHQNNKIGYDIEVNPDFILYQNWQTYHDESEDNQTAVAIGDKIYESMIARDKYYIVTKIENTVGTVDYYSADEDPIRQVPIFDTIIDSITIDEQETQTNGIDKDTVTVYWQCIYTSWTGWTIYTDKLVKIWCTASNSLTGTTIESNSIYFNVTVPNSWLGLYGFRFDTIPESLMDKDPLTI